MRVQRRFLNLKKKTEDILKNMVLKRRLSQ